MYKTGKGRTFSLENKERFLFIYLSFLSFYFSSFFTNREKGGDEIAAFCLGKKVNLFLILRDLRAGEVVRVVCLRYVTFFCRVKGVVQKEEKGKIVFKAIKYLQH